MITKNVIVKKKIFFGNKIIFIKIPLFVIICCEEHTHTKNGPKREREKESTFSPLSVCLFPSLVSPLLFFSFFRFLIP